MVFPESGAVMPGRHWTMPVGAAYGPAVTQSPAVVTVGPLMPDLVAALEERYAARPLEALDPTGDGSGAGVRVAVTTGRTGVRADTLDRLPDLGAVVHFGVGHDRTDLEALAARGVVASTTPDVLTDCVADTAVGLVIDVMRRLSAADRFVRRGEWARPGGGSYAFPLTRKVSGARVGILGLGRIGKAVAVRLEAFGCAVSYTGSRAQSGVDLPYVADLAELAREVDVLVLTCALTDRTRGAVDATVLDALGPDGFLVNVARGAVVDEAAMVAALEGGRLGGAGLDVFADEPQVPAALLERDDVVLLPHLASGTVETRAAMRDLVLANVASFLDDGTLVTPLG